MEETSALYVLGFNHGYTISKYLPDLITQIVKQLSPINDYLSGFFSGKEEYELELEQVQLNELKQLHNQSKDLEQGLEK